MRDRGAKARMVRAMNAVPPLREKDRMGHTRVVPLPRIMHWLHTKRSVRTIRGRVVSGTGRNAPSIADVTINCDSHGLRWLVNDD